MNVLQTRYTKNPFSFSVEKAAQAAATILQLEPHPRMNSHRLLKLLYIADRTALEQMGRPIIGGRLLATTRGPLHSAILDLLHGRAVEAVSWDKLFRLQHYEVEMIENPGNDALSKREIDILHQVRGDHVSRDDVDLGDFASNFKEVKNNRSSDGQPLEIPFDQLLAAVGRSADQAQIEKEAREKAVFDSILIA
jgi:uncharacterized phage-associated protein